ncbi:RNA-guided endonuclease TnpB family protein (plasmid) [Cetobacterium somerae]|uniref:RNA-guided endonuclease TnpB family protein n=1 Tax=Cetobacterium somerae TaxID=188913 RepID=UPI003D766FE4
MIKLNKGYKYRFYPTEEQKQQIQLNFNANRYIWNQFLAIKSFNYKEFARKMGFSEMCLILTMAKKSEEWLCESDSTSLQQTLRQLDDSYKRFFKGLVKYPNFKSKRNLKESYTTKPNIKDKAVKIPKLGEIKIELSRELSVDKIGLCTISKDLDRYYISFNVEVSCKNKFIKTGEKIGIDVGIKSFATISTGEQFQIPKKLWKIESRISFLQRKLSKRIKGSSNYEKLKKAINKLNFQLANIRKDFQHKLSTDLVKRFDVIAIEDLNVKGMMKNRKLARAIGRVSFYSFFNMLKYKCIEHEKELKILNRWFPSSKTCSCCGNYKADLKLSDRVYKCECGLELDRDLNASRNILANA